MSEGGEPDTTRASVKTYVPKYQKEEWRRHAERLDMSQSEFVRTMVQAGRRDFEVPAPGGEGGGDGGESDDGSEGEALALESQVAEVLSSDEYRSWDELVTRLTDDVETRLDDALQSLQSAGRIRYSGREGGYTLVEGVDGE